MNFELLEDRIIEDLFEAEEVFEDRQLYFYPRHIPRMNPYNLAPWHVGYYPARLNGEFRNRYYYPRHYRRFWPISNRNSRRVFNRPTWLPLHIQAQNYRRFQQAAQQVVENCQEKTQFLLNYIKEIEDKHSEALPILKDDRSAEVEFIMDIIKVVMAKYHHYGKNY